MRPPRSPFSLAGPAPMAPAFLRSQGDMERQPQPLPIIPMPSTSRHVDGIHSSQRDGMNDWRRCQQGGTGAWPEQPAQMDRRGRVFGRRGAVCPSWVERPPVMSRASLELMPCGCDRLAVLTRRADGSINESEATTRAVPTSSLQPAQGRSTRGALLIGPVPAVVGAMPQRWPPCPPASGPDRCGC